MIASVLLTAFWGTLLLMGTTGCFYAVVLGQGKELIISLAVMGVSSIGFDHAVRKADKSKEEEDG